MSTLRTAAVITICISASAAFSIGPRLAAVWHDPAALDAETAAFLILQTAATIVLALASHRLALAETIGQRLACLGLATFIAVLQFGAALDVSSHAQDSRAAVASGSLQDRAAVAAALTAALDSRTALPADKRAPVTEAMVEDARTAKQAECDKRGPLCRGKEDELKDLAARRAITAEIERLEKKRDALGTGTAWIDGRAYRFGRIIAALGFDIGKDDTERTAWVMDWWPSFQALVVELIAGLGPYALAKKDGPRQPRRWRVPIIRLPRRRQHVEEVAEQPIAEPLAEPAAVAAAVEKTAVPRTPATAAKSRKPKVSKGAAVTPARDWLKERTTPRAGHQMKPKEEAWADYCAYAESRGEIAMSLTAFGIAMRDDLKIEKRTTPSKRSFYVGIALASKPALAVVR